MFSEEEGYQVTINPANYFRNSLLDISYAVCQSKLYVIKSEITYVLFKIYRLAKKIHF